MADTMLDEPLDAGRICSEVLRIYLILVGVGDPSAARELVPFCRKTGKTTTTKGTKTMKAKPSPPKHPAWVEKMEWNSFFWLDNSLYPEFTEGHLEKEILLACDIWRIKFWQLPFETV